MYGNQFGEFVCGYWGLNPEGDQFGRGSGFFFTPTEGGGRWDFRFCQIVRSVYRFLH